MSYRSQRKSLTPSLAPHCVALEHRHHGLEQSFDRKESSANKRDDGNIDIELGELHNAGPSIRVDDHDLSFPISQTPTTPHGSLQSEEAHTAQDTFVDSLSYQDDQGSEGNKLETRVSNRTDSDPTSSSFPPTGVSLRDGSDNWSETGTNVYVPRRNLTELDVAALIFNKMIGTGIFTTPGRVLASTKSRGISIALWTLGGVWTSLFLLVYLEYGTALPFNGGELIYLDRIYNTPELLFTILFTGFFLAFGNSYGNSISFAKNVLLSADISKAQSSDLDTRLVKFVAIAVVSLVCLLHYWSSRAGLFLNKALFWYKALFLTVVFAAGINYVRNHGTQWNNYNSSVGYGSPMDCLAAMVSIFYTYQGWENANYIAGEIRGLEVEMEAKTLKRGAFLAIGLVWLLYVLVTLAYYSVLDFDSITNNHSDLGMVLHFAPTVFGTSLGMRVCLPLFALGNILAITYTATRVKQAIARQRIIPFWKFFEKDVNTPKGALALHWVSTVIVIAVCPTTSDGYIFTRDFFTYGHLIFSGLVTLGIYKLPKRMQGQFQFQFLRKGLLQTVPILFACGNLLVVSVGATSHIPGNIPRYWWPMTIGLICFGSFFYWAVIMLLTKRLKSLPGSAQINRTIGSKVGFEITIYRADDTLQQDATLALEEAIFQSKQDGTQRRVEYKFTKGFAWIGRMVVKLQKFIAKFVF